MVVVGDAHAAHGRVVLVLAVSVEKLCARRGGEGMGCGGAGGGKHSGGRLARARVHLERALEVKGANVEHPVRRHLRLGAALDQRGRVHRLEARLDAHQVLLADEIRLVQQDAVGELFKARLTRVSSRVVWGDF